jgi:hypothetical protein
MIYFYNRRSVVDCLIRDISPYGARLAERGWRRPRLCLAHAGPGGLGSNYVGLPSMVGRGKDERGESRGIRRANSPPSVPGSTVPRPKIGRGRAPKGDAFSAERAPAEIRRPRKGEGGRGGDHGCAFRRFRPLGIRGATSGGHGGRRDPAAIAAGNESASLKDRQGQTTMTQNLVLYLFLMYCAAVISPGWQ